MSTTTITDLIGLVPTDVDMSDHTMTFTFADGRRFEFFHEQDCCEDVHIAEVIGDPQDLVGASLTIAEEASSSDKTELLRSFGGRRIPRYLSSTNHRSTDFDISWALSRK